MDISAFLQEFRLEALEHLELLGSGLLRLEREGLNEAVLRGMFLSAHTIKGGASMLSLGGIKTLTHALEDVLGALRDGKQGLSTFTVGLLFETLDALGGLVEGELGQVEPTPELENLLERLKLWPRETTPAGGRTQAVAPTPQTPELENRRALLLEPSNTARWVLKAQLERSGFEVTEVSTLEQALTALETTLFACVLCPSEPGGIGPEHLLERFPELRNLWVTALEPIPVPPNARMLLKQALTDELMLERA